MNKHLNNDHDDLNKVQNDNISNNKYEKAMRISDAVGELSEKTISDTDRKRKLAAEVSGKTASAGAAGIWRAKKIWIPAVSAAACGAIVLGTVLGGGVLKNVDIDGGTVHDSSINEQITPHIEPFDDECGTDPYYDANKNAGNVGADKNGGTGGGVDGNPGNVENANPEGSSSGDGSGYDHGIGTETSFTEDPVTEASVEPPANGGGLSPEYIKKALDIGRPGTLDMSEYTEVLKQAEYPLTTPFPFDHFGAANKLGISIEEWWEYDEALIEDWREERQERQSADERLDHEALTEFYNKTAGVFLKNSAGQNRVYSPTNIYLAFSMLAELTDGESREQILELMGFDSIDDLRKQASDLWQALYCNDGMNDTVLANSLWLQKGLEVNSGTVNRIADDYYASVFRGDFGSSETKAALKKWLNDQTGGLLEDSVNNLELSPATLMTLCSTVYFHGTWDNEFAKAFNQNMTFHGYTHDTETEFMTTSDYAAWFYVGEDYTAANLSFNRGGEMWFILPDEDKSIDDVVESGEYLKMLEDTERWENKALKDIHYLVPKFDVASDMDLTDGFRKLGVEDIFDVGRADFSPLLKGNEEFAVGNVDHAARVVIDEEGCTAAAYTVIAAAGGTIPPDYEEVEFVLDRPFLFVITGDTGNVLFVGTVYGVE